MPGRDLRDEEIRNQAPNRLSVQEIRARDAVKPISAAYTLRHLLNLFKLTNDGIIKLSMCS
ncbi:hypothetical protein [Methanosarcina siciliae]|uniref:hypothetical protein n=1 Tax=Methanosarcina siciliae TaxID=38027 RepID=UPI000B2196E2|nr:hypothetical protein [Methanosarcina siciliae]